MASGRNTWRSHGLIWALAFLLLPGLAVAGERTRKQAAPSAPADNVELFAAMKDGLVEVQLIPKDSTLCRVLVKNKTAKPLSVKLPDAFAGVPVLAQAGMGMPGGGLGGGRGGGYGGGYGGGGMSQGFGGGMGGMGFGGMGGMGMGGMGMGGGFFNVPPERVGQIEVTTVCLDHGKRDPRPGVKYEMKPIEEYTSKPAVHELVRMLGRGEIGQRVAQVGAWHLNNDMSWEQLIAKELRFANGTRRPYFSPQEIQGAMQAVAAAMNLAEQRKSQQPPPSTPSASSSSLSQK